MGSIPTKVVSSILTQVVGLIPTQVVVFNPHSWPRRFLFLIVCLSPFCQDLETYFRRRSGRPVVVLDFDPFVAMAKSGSAQASWVDLQGCPAPPPDFGSLPTPDDVLSGRALPDFEGLRLRSQNAFICGNLHQFVGEWDAHMAGVPGFDIVRPWLRDGVHIPSFFQHFKGVFNGRSFNSTVPPPMYFQNAPVCQDYLEFISTTIEKRLEEGSMLCLGVVGESPPPRVVNALSIEPIKPRLILSMRAVNLFCKETPFTLDPLSRIVAGFPRDSFFTSFDDVQGYKQLSITKDSYPFCGFEWGGYWYCDTTLPFGWRNSAYVYTTTGEVLSTWLRQRGIHTALWIDDRFLGLAPRL